MNRLDTVSSLRIVRNRYMSENLVTVADGFGVDIWLRCETLAAKAEGDQQDEADYYQRIKSDDGAGDGRFAGGVYWQLEYNWKHALHRGGSTERRA